MTPPTLLDRILEAVAPVCFFVGLMACAGALLYGVGVAVCFIAFSQ